ncbi:hypothetical protein [Spirosoma sordidisoli]|uniref:Uncharacterized protein n=1 Tax=Spirosoma sordidisoli TaxID=2502893 RepID=A0A4Q2UIY0_9BACT|nr:hypothetical protein [Spirosoma sordidisoli]RYC67501.1 hypothetical protein EQG79_22575 [Spirosoma sordidisoli]
MKWPIYKILLIGLLPLVTSQSIVARTLGVDHRALIEKLVISQAFRDFADNAWALVLYKQRHQQAQTKASQAAEQIRISVLLDHPEYLLTSQKDELARAAGYSSWEAYQQSIVATLSSRDRLLADFPELHTLPQPEAESVLGAAFSRLLESGALIKAQDYVDCIYSAEVNQANCLYGAASTVPAKKVLIACLAASSLATLYYTFRLTARAREPFNRIVLTDPNLRFSIDNHLSKLILMDGVGCLGIGLLVGGIASAVKKTSCISTYEKAVNACAR